MTGDTIAELWPQLEKVATGLGVILFGALTGWITYRVRASKADVSVAGDKATIAALSDLRERCQHLEARDSEMRRQSVEDAKRIGMLTSDVAHWQSEARRLDGMLRNYRDGEDPLATRPAPLGQR